MFEWIKRKFKKEYQVRIYVRSFGVLGIEGTQKEEQEVFLPIGHSTAKYKIQITMLSVCDLLESNGYKLDRVEKKFM